LPKREEAKTLSFALGFFICINEVLAYNILNKRRILVAHLRSRKSFTLVEMLIATVIIAIALCGILAAYVSCYDVLTTSKNVNIATNAAQGLMEEIRNHTFTNITDDYDGLKFTVNNMPLNKGRVYVDDSNPEMLIVTISVCWRQKNRVFGEDQNLNGELDAGEDISNPGIIDSPVQLVMLVVNR
jgi:prepilin-type N-terminal cleavage/methylation domain-containing protein